ncbi:MAG TPA: hypothetical protein VFU47_13180, partial [Armatimonadota bacterium]|nr:hypothetical protein [Armatimonadota bacterium]
MRPPFLQLSRFSGPAALLLTLLAAPAPAQDLSLDLRSATLGQAGEQLQRQTGYDFTISAAKGLLAARRSYTCKDRPLAGVIQDLQKLFNCDFLSATPGGFFITDPPKPEGPESEAGGYRIRVGRIAETRDPTEMQLTLVVTAPDEERMEAIAGLGKELRILDNFSRHMVPPVASDIRTTSAARARLNEYWQRFELSLPDGRSSRIRSIAGTLVLYRGLTPLRFELPLDGPEEARSRAKDGIEAHLDRAVQLGKEVGVAARLSYADELHVVGRGITRTPMPYLVDENG